MVVKSWNRMGLARARACAHVPMLLIVLSACGSDAQEEITAYPARCSNGENILPSSVAYRQFGAGRAQEEMRRAAENCHILPSPRITYRINRARGEVTYLGPMHPMTPAQRLVNCIIHSRLDWVCEYPDYASGIYEESDFEGRIIFIDGLPAQFETELLSDWAGLNSFYMHRWQWRAASILSR